MTCETCKGKGGTRGKECGCFSPGCTHPTQWFPCEDCKGTGETKESEASLKRPYDAEISQLLASVLCSGIDAEGSHGWRLKQELLRARQSEAEFLAAAHELSDVIAIFPSGKLVFDEPEKVKPCLRRLFAACNRARDGKEAAP